MSIFFVLIVTVLIIMPSPQEIESMSAGQSPSVVVVGVGSICGEKVEVC